jgi:flavin-dependent dehydrogenase
MAEICVIGAGPAGSTYAARMAQLGHSVCLVEAARFPRRRLGESLSPGVLPLLEISGARRLVESAGFQHIHKVQVRWEGKPQVREDPDGQGLLVDRGRFDSLLLKRALDVGVRLRQPARVEALTRTPQGWTVEIDAEGSRETIQADYVAEAHGRSGLGRSQRRRRGCRTVALYAYWRGRNLSCEPQIEAGDDFWSWGVPLPDGSYNALVFIDVRHFLGAPRASLETRYLSLLAMTGMARGLEDARLDSPVRTTDATPWLDPDCVSSSRIRVGEAALAIDPISSSGVQRAIQSALSAAIVSNTLLRRPELTAAAVQFCQSNLQEASASHCRWAAEHYGKVAMERGGSFFRDRSAGATLSQPDPGTDSSPGRTIVPRSFAHMRVALSPQLEFVTAPCLDGDFVSLQPALRHPRLAAPVAWVGNHAIVPLLQQVQAPATVLQLAISWSAQVPLSSGIALAGWLLRHEILVDEAELKRA